MEVRQLINFMSKIEKLKCNTRHSWTSTNRHESVAEHSWRLSMLAYFVKDEFPYADINKVILMCLCHDLGEAITGDIPAFYKTAKDENIENDAVIQLLNELPSSFKEELILLFDEMKSLNTLEARIYKALDKLETLLQHNEADISTWIPLEYEANLTYGNESVKFSDYMIKFKNEINLDSVKKINEANLG